LVAADEKILIEKGSREDRKTRGLRDWWRRGAMKWE
jgi:hypothetical protein